MDKNGGYGEIDGTQQIPGSNSKSSLLLLIRAALNESFYVLDVHVSAD